MAEMGRQKFKIFHATTIQRTDRNKIQRLKNNANE